MKTKVTFVATGFGQVRDIDYFQAFVPTPSPALVKIVTAVVSEHRLNYQVFHFNVSQAFVRAKLDHDINVQLSPGGGCGTMSGKAVRLNRSLYYGLKQNGLQWAGL